MKLERLWTLAAALALLASPALAAHPDMSGTWLLDPAKSDFAQVPIPADLTLTIKVEGPEFYVNQTGGGQPDIALHFSTSGKEVTNDLPGAKMVSTHRWEGEAMVGEIRILTDDGNKMTFHDQITYSPDGKVMTLKSDMSGPMGEAQIRVVMNKK
jgi:hypothetical protein